MRFETIVILDKFEIYMGKARERYTAEHVAAVLTETKGLVYIAAQRLQCTPQTVYNYIDRHPSVKAAREAATEQMVDYAELRFYEAIHNREPWAISMMLKTKGRNRGYVDQPQTHLHTQVTLHELQGLSDAEILTLLEGHP